MRTIIAMWGLVAALGTVGCSSMMSDPDRMRTMIEDVREENDLHVALANGATMLGELREEVSRHDAAMDDMMEEMGGAMDGMSHCTGAGMGDMRAMRHDMMGEMDRHRSTIDQATDLGGAREDVGHHDGVMQGLLGGMDEAAHRMGCQM
jgi:hypothetical protein